MFPPERTATTGPFPPTRSGQQQRRPEPRPLPRRQLRPLEQEHDRLADLLVADRDDVVEHVAQDRGRQLPRMLDGDALGDREPADLAAGERSERGRLHAYQPRLRLHGPDRERDPGREPAAADRDDDRLQVGNLVEELEPDRALPGDHASSSKAWTNVAPCRRRGRARRRAPRRRSRRGAPCGRRSSGSPRSSPSACDAA